MLSRGPSDVCVRFLVYVPGYCFDGDCVVDFVLRIGWVLAGRLCGKLERAVSFLKIKCLGHR